MPYSSSRYTSDSYGGSTSYRGVKEYLSSRTASYEPPSYSSRRPTYNYSTDLERTKSEDFRPSSRYKDDLRDLDSQLNSLKLSSSSYKPSYTTSSGLSSSSNSHYLRRPSMGSSTALSSSGLHNRYTSAGTGGSSVTSTLPSLSPSSGVFNNSPSRSYDRHLSSIPPSGQSSGRSRTSSGGQTASSTQTDKRETVKSDYLRKMEIENFSLRNSVAKAHNEENEEIKSWKKKYDDLLDEHEKLKYLEDAMSCGVCFEKYDNDEHEQACITSCFHAFCYKCIDSLNPKICPKCRNNFNNSQIKKIF